MTLVKNNDGATRRWDWLVDNGTGRTLLLRGGQMADVTLPDDFSDPYLVPVATPVPPTPGDALPAAPETPTASPEVPEGTDQSTADPSAPVEEQA